MKVAIYCRISKDNLGQDIDRQIYEVREYCKRMNYEIVEEYLDEGYTPAQAEKLTKERLENES